MPKQRELQIVTTLKDEASGKLQKSFSKIQDTGRKMQSTGRTLTKGLTLPIAGAGAAAATSAAKWEEGMGEIQAQADLTESEMGSVEGAMERISSKTGKSMSDIQEAMTIAQSSSLGLEEANRAVEASAMATASGFGGMRENINMATTLMKKFGGENITAEEMMGKIIGVGDDVQAQMDDFVPMLMKGSASMQQFGISVEDGAAVFGKLADSARNTRAAGRQYRQLLKQLSAPQADLRDLLEETFGSMGNFRAEMEDDTIGTLYDVRDALNSSDQSWEELLGRQEAVSGASNLFASSQEEIRELAEKNADGAEVLNEKFKESDNIIRTLKAACQILKIAIKPVGQVINETLKPALKKVSEWAKQASSWFKNLSGNTQEFIVVVAGLAAILGPVLFLLGGLAIVVGSISTPILVTIAALSGLVAVFAALGDSVKEVWNFIKEPKIFDWFQKAFTILKRELSDALSSLRKEFRELWKVLEPVLIPALRVMAIVLGTLVWGAIMGIATALTGLVHILSLLAKEIRKFVKKGRERIRDLGATIMEIILEVENRWNTFTDTINRVWKETWENIQTIFDGIINGIKGQIKSFKEFIFDIWDKIKEPLNKMKNAGKDMGGPGMAFGPAGGLAGRVFDDVLVTSGGKVVPISSQDNVLAFKGNGVGGNVTVNVNAPVYGMDEEDVAEQLGNKMVEKLNLSRKL